MLKSRAAVRRSARIIADAVSATRESYVVGRTQQEPSITDRMLGRIEQSLNGVTVKGVKWTAMTLTDRGAGIQEKKYGADFLGVLEMNLPEYKVTKGFLAQAKRIEPDGSMRSAEFDRMVAQCNKMLELSSAAFVFLYGKERFGVVSAAAVAGLRHRTNPWELYSRSVQRFFEEHFQCFIGDRRLHTPHVDTLATLRGLADENSARSALLLSASSES